MTNPLSLRTIAAKAMPDSTTKLPTKAKLSEALYASNLRATHGRIDATYRAAQELSLLREQKRQTRSRLDRKRKKRIINTFNGTPQDRLTERRQIAIRRAAESVMHHGAPAGTKFQIDFGPIPYYRLTTHIIQNVYRDRYKSFAARSDHHHIIVPRDWLRSVQARGLATVANALTLTAISYRSPHQDIEVVSAIIARSGRGYSAIIESRLYARQRQPAANWVHILHTDLTPTRAAIRRTSNAERRRIMLQIYDINRFLKEIKAHIIDQSKYGRLYHWRPANGLTQAIVEVIDATDPQRHYTLLVPPSCKTAREAVAWTFDLLPQQYDPQLET